MKQLIKDIYQHIYRNDIEQLKNVLQSISETKIKEVLNYQLTQDDIEVLIEIIEPTKYDECPGLTFFGEPEIGMTPLLMALSLERISISMMLTNSIFAKYHDFNLTNCNNITYLHILFMASYGDGRYDDRGNQIAIEKDPDLKNKILEMVINMIDNLHPQIVYLYQQPFNFIASSFEHNLPEVAEILIQNNFPMPCNQSDFEKIRFYLIGSCPPNSGEAENRLAEIIRILNISPECSCEFKNLISKSDIKEVLRKFSLGNDKIDNIELLSLLHKYIKLTIGIGIKLTVNDFTDWLSGAGKNICNEVKEALLDQDILDGKEDPCYILNGDIDEVFLRYCV